MTVKLTKIKKAASIVLATLTLSFIDMNSANAADIAVSVDSINPYYDYQVNSSGGNYQIRVLGYDPFVQLYSGTAITGFNNSATSPSGNYLAFNDDGGGALPDRLYSQDSLLTGTLTSGDYVIRVTSWRYWLSQPSPTQSYTLRYTGLSSGTTEANVRQTNNLSFAQSLHGSDKLSDNDGQLRATVDQIMNKYGSLVK
jgi:hypothetical protein